ncbi:neuromedin-u receptor 1 [Plakobranchus ocellatus]|uniref:Neuromedin-u receptor 1 n=1 Tax=Plakobranchus ocellatus TaxID=259542 RepID=A0AAV3YNP0_9GAST|nr:neuromedin-u receptor 1 [Plakobranchus ocellatus]
MAHDKYYFFVNDEACCQLHLLINQNNHQHYYDLLNRQQQEQQQQQQAKDLHTQDRSTPSLVKLFSPYTPSSIATPSTLTSSPDLIVDGQQIHPYSTVTSAPTAAYSLGDPNHQQDYYNTHEKAVNLGSIAPKSVPACLPLDISSISLETQQDKCPSVVYSYDGVSGSLSTLIRDGVQNALLPGPNATWEDLKRITSNGTDDITVLCNPASVIDVVGTNYGTVGFLMGESLNDTSAITSAYTFSSNVSAFFQNLSDVNFSIVSEHEYLEFYLGKRYLSNAIMITLMIIYSIIFFTGVVGNLCTCLVITRNRFLHTATNYYLFSLAISDMLTLFLGCITGIAVKSLALVVGHTTRDLTHTVAGVKNSISINIIISSTTTTTSTTNTTTNNNNNSNNNNNDDNNNNKYQQLHQEK